jgi:hypothetical protein
MRRFFLIFLPVALVLAAAGVFLYRDPQVRGLFESGYVAPVIPKVKTVTKRPAPGRKSLKYDGAPVRSTRKSAGVPLERPVPAEGLTADPAAERLPQQENNVPNPVLSRTILRILMAKGLGDGISISVSDQNIVIAGFVKSEEKRREILAVIDKARENRTVEASHLKVAIFEPETRPQEHARDPS